MSTAEIKQYVDGLMVRATSQYNVWQQYTATARATMAAYRLPRRQDPIIDRASNIHGALRVLEGRRQVLTALQATDLDEMPRAYEFIVDAPIEIRGSDEPFSVVQRAVDMAECGVMAIRAVIEAGERSIVQRFDHLPDNYVELIRFFDTYAEKHDNTIAVLKMHERVEQAVFYKGVEVEEAEKKFGLFEEAKRGCFKFVGIFERQVMQFERDLAGVGIRVARQTMIDEFFT